MLTLKEFLKTRVDSVSRLLMREFMTQLPTQSEDLLEQYGVMVEQDYEAMSLVFSLAFMNQTPSPSAAAVATAMRDYAKFRTLMMFLAEEIVKASPA